MKYLIILSVIILGWGCKSNNKQGSEPAVEPAHTHTEHAEEGLHVELEPRQIAAIGIQSIAITEMNMDGLIRVNGKIDVPPQNLVYVHAVMGGHLKSTELLPGMKIAKGQLIAVLEHPDYIQLQQDYLDKHAQLVFLQEEYERQQKLNGEEVSSTRSFQEARSHYESMRAQVSGLAQKLKMSGINPEKINSNNISPEIKIYSPVSGYVSGVNVNIGKYVSQGETLFEIVNTEHFHVEMTIYERDISKIKIGQRLSFRLPNDPTLHWARVYLIGKKINDDRSISVHCHFEKEDPELVYGMIVEGEVHTGTQSYSVVPSDAIIVYEGKKYIFLQEEPTKEGHVPFRMMEVSTGPEEGQLQAITPLGETLPANAMVVKAGAFSLLSQVKAGEGDDHGH